MSAIEVLKNLAKISNHASPSCSKSQFNDRICRTCMGDIDLYPLFPKIEKYENFVRALYLSTGLHIKSDDGLPQHICKKCAKIIQSAMKFRAKSQLTDRQLRLLLDEHRRQLKDANVVNNKEAFNLTQLKQENENSIQLDLEKCETNDELDYSNESDKSYGQQDSLKNVLRVSLKSIPMKEPRRRSISPSIYMEFLQGELQTGERPVCKICTKSYKTVNNLKAHVEHAHGDRKLLCEFCGLSFPSNIHRLRHLRAKHNLARDDSFACSYCGFQALDKEQLQSHERREHTKDRPFVCDECGESFFTRRVLKQHSFRHKTETPYHCDICPKKFKLRPKLNQHKNMVHFKKKRRYIFGCYVCSNKFQTPYNVRKHLMRMHHIPKDQQGKVLRFSREQDEDAINSLPER